jgi:hypothetical protein
MTGESARTVLSQLGDAISQLLAEDARQRSGTADGCPYGDMDCGLGVFHVEATVDTGAGVPGANVTVGHPYAAGGGASIALSDRECMDHAIELFGAAMQHDQMTAAMRLTDLVMALDADYLRETAVNVLVALGEKLTDQTIPEIAHELVTDAMTA